MLIDGKPVEVLETPYREVAYLRADNERLKTTLCKYQHIASPEDRKVTKLLTEIERLKAELAEAKKDAERLDYVQEHRVTIAIVPLTTGGLLGFEIGGILKSKRFYLREAIDAAMKGK